MKTKEYRGSVDRSGWPVGPWDSEPDKVQWPDAETRLPCIARRSGVGSWCGYVGVAEGHPYFGKEYGDIDVDVHGGLTFAEACDPNAHENRDICHVPGPGEPVHVHWFGFDCAHFGDESPAMMAIHQKFSWHDDNEYRTLDYVKRECASLAKQLAAAA